MKRLLCIVDSMNVGGAETFLMKILRKLDKDKYIMDFIVSDYGFYDKEIKDYGGRIYKIPLRTKNPIGAMLGIVKIVKKNKYKVVLKLSSTPISTLDLLAAKIGGAKLLAIRSCNAYAEESIFNKLINAILRPLFYKIVNLKIAPSELAGEFTFGKKAMENNEVILLHNAIDLNVFKYDVDDRKKMAKEFKTEGKTVYGHIGRFSKQKNHKFLIEIFEKIYLKDPNAILLLVGEGNLKKEIYEEVKRKKIENNVIFAGIRTDISKILSLIDVFVFPSFYEGMPNTVIEAQAVGVKCIISDSITRQANITGLVKYLPLNIGAEKWAEECLNTDKTHKITKEEFIKAGYSISFIRDMFVKLFFKEE